MLGSVDIIVGDCREVLQTLPEKHFHCCVTSPPYFGLRSYATGKWVGGDPECEHDTVPARGGRGGSGSNTKNTAMVCRVPVNVCRCGAEYVDKQIGMEPTPDDFVEAMLSVFGSKENPVGIWRVLRDDGVAWLNLGDSYAASGGGSLAWATETERKKKRATYGDTPKRAIPGGLKPKDLIGIPWRVAFALQSAGWYLRDAVIWQKPSPMPGSQRDRCTSSYEYVFMLTKSARYAFDMEAIKEPLSCPEAADRKNPIVFGGSRKHTGFGNRTYSGNEYTAQLGGRTPRNVWKTDWSHGDVLAMLNLMSLRHGPENIWRIASEGFSGSHFAVFPRKLAEKPIKASTSEKGCCAQCGTQWIRQVERVRVPTRPGLSNTSDDTGMANRDEQRHVTSTRTVGWMPGCECDADTVPCRVIDPFGGACTTGLAAKHLGVDATLIELSEEYAEMGRQRVSVPLDRGDFAQYQSLPGQQTLF